jgi:hypothetical protein
MFRAEHFRSPFLRASGSAKKYPAKIGFHSAGRGLCVCQAQINHFWPENQAIRENDLRRPFEE